MACLCTVFNTNFDVMLFHCVRCSFLPTERGYRYMRRDRKTCWQAFCKRIGRRRWSFCQEKQGWSEGYLEVTRTESALGSFLLSEGPSLPSVSFHSPPLSFVYRGGECGGMERNILARKSLSEMAVCSAPGWAAAASSY